MQAELLVDAQAELAESPVWDDRTNELLWVDILGGQVHRVSEDGTHKLTVDVGEHIGAVALTEDDGMVVATTTGFRRIDPEADHPMLAAIPDARAGIRMNDGKCDPAGRFVAGTMSYAETRGAGALYSFNGREVRRLLSGVTISNGLAWSGDGRTMYYVDTPTRCVDAFDYDIERGEISGRRTAIELEARVGAPDGITVDVDGGVWVALWGGGSVRRYEDGAETHRVSVPTPLVTSLTIGGAANDTMFITSARTEDGSGGQLFAAHVDAGALPVRRFGPSLADQSRQA